MPYMVWESLLNSPQPSVATTNNNGAGSTASLFDASVAPQFVLPANFLQAGSALRFTAWGVFSTTGTPTLLLGIYYGGVAGTALATTAATTTASAASNLQWRLELVTTIRTTGSSGTAISQGMWGIGTTATAMTFNPLPQAAPSTVTVDTTAAKALTVGAQWGTANASNVLTLNGFQIESLGA